MESHQFLNLFKDHAFFTIGPESNPDGNKRVRVFTEKEKALAVNEQKGDLYFSPNGFANIKVEGKRTKDAVTSLNALWIDIDDESRTVQEIVNDMVLACAERGIPPTAVVKTGKGAHAYWVLKEPLSPTPENRVNVERALKGLQQSFEFLKSDPAVAEIARIMRVPGSRYWKDNSGRVLPSANVHEKNLYELSQFDPFLAELKEKPKATFDEAFYAKMGTRHHMANVLALKIGNTFKFQDSYKEVARDIFVASFEKGYEQVPGKPYTKQEALGRFDEAWTWGKQGALERETARKAGVYSNIKMVDDARVEQIHEDISLFIPFEQGRVVFLFTEIFMGYKEFETTLEVRVETATGNLPSFKRNINTNSASSVTDLRRTLESAYKEVSIPWPLMLNRAFNLARETYLEADDMHFFSGEKMEDEAFLLEPFLQKDGANLIYGEGSTGKSYFCLYMAACLATGKDFFHVPITEKGIKTAWIDYEGGGKKKFISRLHRIAAGLGVPYDELASHIGHYQPRGSISDVRTHLKNLVTKHGVALIVVDAGASASGGSPNDEGAVIKLYTALERIPGTKLIIHHEPKEASQEDRKAYYGTTYWNTYARAMHRLMTETTEDKWKKVLKVIHTKTNDSYAHDTFFYRMSINKPTEPAYARFEYYEGVPQGTAQERIANELSGGKKLSRNQIAESLDLDPEYVKKILVSMKASGDVEFDGAARSSLWKLTEKGTQKPHDF